MTLRNVGVIGAGTMGNGIAQTFALAGFDVVVRDLEETFLERGRAAIEKSLGRLVTRGNLTEGDAKGALDRIRTTTDLGQLGDRELIVEAIVEDYDIKSRLIAELDEIYREDAIFATNTSSISLTKLAAVSRVPERVIGMHFFNPVPVMQLVEIIRALQTSDAVHDAVVDTTVAIGKKPYPSKDSYGFVVNRVLVPMLNEAINCVYEDLAKPEEVDAMLKLGANHPMGPLALADLIGLDVVLHVMETLYEGFNDPKYRPSPLLKQMVDARYLGRKTGRGFHHYEPH